MNIHGTDRLAATWRGLGYLLGNLATTAVALSALPVLVIPTMARAWASWHRRQAGRLLLSPLSGPVRVRTWRVLGWLCTSIVTSLVFGLVVVLCAGNAVVTAVMVPLWWVFPAGS